MPIPEDDISAVHDRESLFALLEQLGWSVAAEDTFTYNVPPANRANQPKVTVSRIPPFSGDDPYVLVLAEFETDFRRTDLRGILRDVRAHLRATGTLQMQRLDQIVFVCATRGYRGVRFAHFEQADENAQPRLRVFGWDRDQTGGMATVRRVNLEALRLERTLDGAPDWARASWSEAWNVEAVTKSFYDDYEKVFHQVELQIEGAFGDKRLFTQRLFNRLFFIRFVEMKGWLRYADASGVQRTDYLRALLQAAENGNFYHDRLYWAFFSGLGTFGDPGALGLDELRAIRGEVPYLNGGLFDMEPDGSDNHGAVRIPNGAFASIFGMFDRYNFTVTESSPDDVEVAVDPEMLGKVFEELVTKEERSATGGYYTPRPVVSFMCREVLKGFLGGHEALVDQGDDSGITLSIARSLLEKLEGVKVVDPACGSGAYLLGMLRELFNLTRLLEVRAQRATPLDDYERKREIIQNNLFGVDMSEFAVQIARLRLWLSLVVEFDGPDPPPLPNLDFKIEAGDSLTAPDPVLAPTLWRHDAIQEFRRVKAQFMRAHDYEIKRDLRARIDTSREEIRQGAHAGVLVSGFDWVVEFSEVFETGGFDIVLANPPYGASGGDGVRNLYFNPQTDGAQSKDTYGLFMARGLQLLRSGGQFSFIVSDTWRTIRTHRPLRKRLLAQTAVSHVLDLPSWIFKATVNTCVLTVTKAAPTDGHTLIAGDLRNIPAGAWESLESNLRAVAAHGPDVQTTAFARYTYPQSVVATYANCAFFIGSPRLYSLFGDPKFARLEQVADVKQGLATADNEYYLRKHSDARGSYRRLEPGELLSESEIAVLSADERRNGVDPARYQGRHFLPYDKGGESDADEGWMPNYYVPTGYFIDWSRDAVHRLRTATIADVKRRKGGAHRIKASDQIARAAVIRNVDYYFRPGITFSRTGIYAPTYRINSATVFDTEGSSIFSDEVEPEAMLALMVSMLARYVVKNFVDHSVHAQVDDLKEMPVAQIDRETRAELMRLVAQIVAKQKADPRYPYHLHEQKDIDALVYQLYGLDEKDVREVELWYCRRYEKLARAQGAWDEVSEKHADFLEWSAHVMLKPAGYWRSHPTLALIAKGEGDNVEFKETLAVDNERGAPHAGVLVSALKTIAAFLNTSGGILLIGVSDSGGVKGLDKDLRHCHRSNQDGFEQKLRSLLHGRFDPAPIGSVDIHFDALPEGTVCRVEVKRSRPIVHFDKDVYVRDGNATRKLEGRALTDWIAARHAE